MFKINKVITVTALVFLSGCMTIGPMVTSEEENQNKKSFIPTDGMSSVYIYRNQVSGMTRTLGLSVDGQIFSKMCAFCYMHVQLPPGRHTIVSTGTTKRNILQLETQANQTYFIQNHVSPFSGFHGPNGELKVINDAAEGRKAVLASKPLKVGTLSADSLYSEPETPKVAFILGREEKNTLTDDVTLFVRTVDGKLIKEGRRGWSTPLRLTAGLHEVTVEMNQGMLYANAKIKFEAKANSTYSIQRTETSNLLKRDADFWLVEQSTGQQITEPQKVPLMSMVEHRGIKALESSLSFSESQQEINQRLGFNFIEGPLDNDRLF